MDEQAVLNEIEDWAIDDRDRFVRDPWDGSPIEATSPN